MHDFRQWWDTVWAQAVHDQQLLGTHAFEVNQSRQAARRVRVTRDHRRSYGKCHRVPSHTGTAASSCAMTSSESANRHATEAALHGTHEGMPVKSASRTHSNKDSVIGCHARRSVILEVCFSCYQRRAHGSKPNPGRHERFDELPKSLGAGKVRYSLRTGRASQEVELRGGLAGAGVYPLNKTFATESSTIADWDQSS